MKGKIVMIHRYSDGLIVKNTGGGKKNNFDTLGIHQNPNLYFAFTALYFKEIRSALSVVHINIQKTSAVCRTSF